MSTQKYLDLNPQHYFIKLVLSIEGYEFQEYLISEAIDKNQLINKINNTDFTHGLEYESQNIALIKSISEIDYDTLSQYIQCI